jgi:hypothetical protein
MKPNNVGQQFMNSTFIFGIKRVLEQFAFEMLDISTLYAIESSGQVEVFIVPHGFLQDS